MNTHETFWSCKVAATCSSGRRCQSGCALESVPSWWHVKELWVCRMDYGSATASLKTHSRVVKAVRQAVAQQAWSGRCPATPRTLDPRWNCEVRMPLEAVRARALSRAHQEARQCMCCRKGDTFTREDVGSCTAQSTEVGFAAGNESSESEPCPIAKDCCGKHADGRVGGEAFRRKLRKVFVSASPTLRECKEVGPMFTP